MPFIVLYADDILIFAPSLQELQNIVNTCELELMSFDMAINTKKRQEILLKAHWTTSRC